MRKKVKLIAGVSLMALGVWAIIYAIGVRFYNVTFWKYLLLLGLLSCGVGLFKLLFKKEIKSKKVRRIIASFHIIIILMIVSFFTVQIILKIHASKKDTTNPDYVVILGAGLWGDTPSQILSYRLNASMELIKALPEDIKIIVSGGQGPGETITEAEAMKRYLVSEGIDTDRIIKEERSTNTLENLQYTKNLIRNFDSKDDLDITLVTSTFHMFRSKTLAKRVGFDEIYCWNAPVHPFIEPMYYFREYLALVKSTVFDWPSDENSDPEVGEVTDEYKGVKVYNNGRKYTENHGKNYSEDGYYYGYKWQCVEYIKRFYYDALGHEMPNVYGHAKDFFNVELDQGELNKDRNLYQYKNGGNMKPQVDDLIVFNDTTYGHIGIVSEVGEDYIEIVQQNIYIKPREKFTLTEEKGCFFVGSSRKPAGWLRKTSF
jgi:uncharacterized SAM-binding protein YcdF (DUF218 family)/surface antigen